MYTNSAKIAWKFLTFCILLQNPLCLLCFFFFYIVSYIKLLTTKWYQSYFHHLEFNISLMLKSCPFFLCCVSILVRCSSCIFDNMKKILEKFLSFRIIHCISHLLLLQNIYNFGWNSTAGHTSLYILQSMLDAFSPGCSNEELEISPSGCAYWSLVCFM